MISGVTFRANAIRIIKITIFLSEAETSDTNNLHLIIFIYNLQRISATWNAVFILIFTQ